MGLWLKRPRQVRPWLYALESRLGVQIYVLVGGARALVFDTGYGLGDLPAAVRRVTKLPYTVVLSHGHVDHACGACQFPAALVHPADISLAREHTSPEYRALVVGELARHGVRLPARRAARYEAAGPGALEPLAQDAVFELGGLTVRAMALPGHTQGSVGLLAEQHRWLLAGDAANRCPWMFFPESSTLEAYAGMLARARQLPFDTFCTGHDAAPQPKAEWDVYLSVARHATLAAARPVELPGAFGRYHPYAYRETGPDGREAGILFAPEKAPDGEVGAMLKGKWL